MSTVKDVCLLMYHACTLLELADWDFTKSHLYARVAIRYLISTRGKSFQRNAGLYLSIKNPPILQIHTNH